MKLLRARRSPQRSCQCPAASWCRLGRLMPVAQRNQNASPAALAHPIQVAKGSHLSSRLVILAEASPAICVECFWSKAC